MLELAEETQTANWKRKTESFLAVLQKELQENIDHRKKELEEVQQQIQDNELHIWESNTIREIVLCALQGETKPISVLSGETWSILGYRLSKEGSTYRVVVGKKTGGTEPICVWANTKMEKLLAAVQKYLEKETDSYKRTLAWYPREHGNLYKREERSNSMWEGRRTGIYIRVLAQKTFRPSPEKEIAYYPIEIEDLPTTEDLPSVREVLLDEEYEKISAKTNKLLYETCTPPPSTKWKNTKDMESGEYICTRYASTEYRKKKKNSTFFKTNKWRLNTSYRPR